ncbi:MAG: hypothetical protein K0R19_495 [Bacillota bacterium]|jgi:membrane protease subunit (stomatin/prohibitin family)|nr:hypothetical protein [Bacillota bacterium]
MAIIDVVKYNGGPDVFAWKYPNEELSTWTQLIVNETQEAVLVKGGEALDLFGSGTHSLDTNNIPILCNLINLPFGGRSPFTAEVWFINRAASLDIKWGTQSPIQLQDPKYQIFIPVRSYGQFGIQIKNSKKFLTKLVGTLPILDKETIQAFFRGLYLTKVKDAISSYLVQEKISILEMNAYLEELSENLREKMAPIMSDYGIELIHFNVNDISVPDEDPAVRSLKSALSKRAEMDIVGYNYIQQRSFETLESAASKGGATKSDLMGAGIGAGIGVGISGALGAQFAGMAQNINTAPEKKEACPSCGTSINKDSKFCGNCGTALRKSCPGCGEPLENPAAKFCTECGYSLLKKCSGCGAELQGEPKFCPECGGKL